MTFTQLETNVLFFIIRVGGSSPYGVSIALGLGEKRTMLAMYRLLRFGLIAERPATPIPNH